MAPCHLSSGGTLARMVNLKCRGDGCFFSEVLQKGGVSDPLNRVKIKSYGSKQAVFKLCGAKKDKRTGGQESLAPHIHVL